MPCFHCHSLGPSWHDELIPIFSLPHSFLVLTVAMPLPLRSVTALLLVLCLLFMLSSGDGRVKRAAAISTTVSPASWVAEEDDFTLTPEQERLLFEDVPIAPFAPTPPAAADAAAALTPIAVDGSHKGTGSDDNDTSANKQQSSSDSLASLPHTPAPAAVHASSSNTPSHHTTSIPDVSSCPDDFGGVSRVLSALFSPTAIRRSGRWSIHTSISQSDYNTLTRLLRNHKLEDALDLVQLGEKFLRSASYHSSGGNTWGSEDEDDSSVDESLTEGPLTFGLVWLQRWARQLERVLHHRLVAPLHLPTTASLLLHGALVLMLPAAVFIALRMATPVVVNVVSPVLQQRHISNAALSSSSNSHKLTPSPSASRSSNTASTALTQQHGASSVAPNGRRAVRPAFSQPSSPESFVSALWIGLLLLLLALFTSGYVHHYHTLHIEQLARNRIIQSNPPPGCYQTNEPASLVSLITTFTTYLTRSQRDDACWRYEASLLQSSWPNPLLVLSSYLSTVLLHPLAHVGEAMGGFTRGFLSHHSVVMQGVMLTFLLLFSLGVVALCMMGGKACMVRWCCGWGGRINSSRPGSSGVMSRSRDDRAARRRRRDEEARNDWQLLDDEQDSDAENWEDEQRRESGSSERRRLVRRLLREHRQRVEDEEQSDKQQLLRLMAAKKEDTEERERQREEDGAANKRTDESSRDERDRQLSAKKAGKQQKAVKFHPEALRAEEEGKMAVKQEQQMAAEREEGVSEQKDESAAAAVLNLPASSSVPVSRSSHTSNYPVCSAAPVKQEDEETLEWSANPIDHVDGARP